MSELRNRMLQDMQLAGLVEGTRREYLRAVRQLTGYYMVPPDRLSERKVEQYLLYVRDELGVAQGTFAPIVAGRRGTANFFVARKRVVSVIPPLLCR
jgi:hypothetical protein